MKTDASILNSLVRNVMQAEKSPLTAMIDEYLLKRDLPKYRERRAPLLEIPVVDRARPMGRLSPSSICGCKRETIFRFTGVKGSRRRINPETELIFEDGKWRHHKWGWLFKDMEAVLGRGRFRLLEIEGRCLYPEMYIAGHLDALIEIKYKGVWTRYVVDFKGANNWAFETVFRSGKPIDKHVDQLITYCMVRKEDKGLLIYDNKNDQRFKVFNVEVSDAKVEEITGWINEIKGLIEENTLPPIDPDCKGGTFLYERCRYTPLCYGSMTDEELVEHTYRDFTSMTALWRKGLRLERE